MLVIVVEGGPRERGRACGEALRGKIAACLDAIDRAGENDRKIPAGKFRAEFLQATSFGGTIAQWTPDLLDEVRGLGEGANQPFERMLYAQLMDEEWVYARNLKYAMEADAGHCTGFAVRERDRAVIAQNMDLGQWLDGYQAVVRHIDRAAGFDIQMLTFAGYLGLCGLNANGPAVCCNTLLDLDASPTGLPVAFVFRSLVQSHSVAEAERTCRGFPHASGQNYIIGGKDDVVSLECSAHQIVNFQIPGLPERVYHTNHALANTETSYVDRHVKNSSIARRCRSPSSPARLASVAAHVGDSNRKIDVAFAMETLRAKDDPAAPVCRDGNASAEDAQIGFTFGSIICEISDEPAMYVAAGPPCHSSYRRLDFRHPRELTPS
jgi:isopenicillin-N N-acyltransferase-like protein